MPKEILSPCYSQSASGPMNVRSMISQTVSEPLAQNDKNLEAELCKSIQEICGTSRDVEQEKVLFDHCSKAMRYFSSDYTMAFDQIFCNQAAARYDMPEPTSSLIYTVEDDIIPVCERFMTNSADSDELLATFMFYARPAVLGVYVRNAQDYRRFVSQFSKAVSPNLSKLGKDAQLVQAFISSDISPDTLTKNFWLRSEQDQNNGPNSFARLLCEGIMAWSKKDPARFGLLPFSLRELYCPKAIVFINVAAHANADPLSIHQHWSRIRKGLQAAPSVLSMEELEGLDCFDENMQKCLDSLQSTVQQLNSKVPPVKRSLYDMETCTVKAPMLLKRIKTIIKSMNTISRSNNVQRKTIRTYARANRRDPDDPNRKGTGTRLAYYPDIHIYADTSGSISKDMYERTVDICIRIAKELNVNVYFNSFSTVLSPQSLIPLKGNTIKQAQKRFRAIKTVGGGTNFSQVWSYILQSKKRRSELSLMITDFGYSPGHAGFEHPKNLYYIPCDGLCERSLNMYAENFISNMQLIDPKINKKILL